MIQRFLAEGKPGATIRSGAPYSTWFNGGLRTTTSFHNIIGLLTETIGSPTPTADSARGREATCPRATTSSRSPPQDLALPPVGGLLGDGQQGGARLRLAATANRFSTTSG